MSPLIQTIRGWSAARRRWATVLFVALVFPLAVWTGYARGNIFVQPDAEIYVAMAQGQAGSMPFASRQLGPLVVRAMMHLPHLPLQTAFLVLGLASMLMFVGTIAFLLVRSDAPQWTIYAIAGLMFWTFQFNSLVMPDLLYAALLCGFLLLLRQGQVMAACLMLFPLMLARESTLLTLVCFLIAGWRRLRKVEVAAAVGAVGIAMVIVKRLTANALPNAEHISPMLYLIAKMPWNFMRNVLGIGMWANVYPGCTAPTWQMAVHLGPLTAIGTCGYFPGIQGELLGFGTTVFGLLPLMVWLVRKQMLRTGECQDLMLRFSLIYGTFSFLMAPLLGETFVRLYGYGWPLILVALPTLLGRTGANFKSGWAAAAFLGLHWFAAWSMAWAFPGWLFQVGLGCWILGWILLITTFRAEAPSVAAEVPAAISA